MQPWSEEEYKALVSWVLFVGFDERWPVAKPPEFWDYAAMFVASIVCSGFQCI